jgi:hypothetical protein
MSMAVFSSALDSRSGGSGSISFVVCFLDARFVFTFRLRGGGFLGPFLRGVGFFLAKLISPVVRWFAVLNYFVEDRSVDQYVVNTFSEESCSTHLIFNHQIIYRL